MENLRITENIQNNLLTATKWLKFMTILSIVGGVALCFFIGIVLLLIPTYDEPVTVPVALYCVIYMLLTLLNFYPIKKSFDLIKNTRDAMGNASQMGLEQAAANVKSILKYFGILSIVYLSISALIFVIGFIVVIVGIASVPV